MNQELRVEKRILARVRGFSSRDARDGITRERERPHAATMFEGLETGTGEFVARTRERLGAL